MNYAEYILKSQALAALENTPEISKKKFGRVAIDQLNALADSTEIESLDFNIYLQFFLSYCFIPGGVFKMGSPEDSGSLPVRTVDVSSFFMSETPTTFTEWQAVVVWAKENGYSIDKWFGDDYSAPLGTRDAHVAGVSWFDAVKWCNAKSEMLGYKPCYYTGSDRGTVYREGKMDLTSEMVDWSASGFRLPTEAEWEKAARGGLIGKRYPNGNVLTTHDANFGRKVGESWSRELKSYPENGYGLYSMVGGNSEWCWDWAGSYDRNAVDNPAGPRTGSHRVVRGGCPLSGAEKCTVSFRVRKRAKAFAGFRVVSRFAISA
jgi:sulfatase modifying factor 1